MGREISFPARAKELHYAQISTQCVKLLSSSAAGGRRPRHGTPPYCCVTKPLHRYNYYCKLKREFKNIITISHTAQFISIAKIFFFK